MGKDTNVVRSLRQIERPKFKFRIKTETYGDRTIFTPLVKERGKFDIFTPWQQIVKVYDEYIILYLPGNHNLTFADCEEHIKQYKIQEDEKFNKINAVIEYSDIYELAV